MGTTLMELPAEVVLHVAGFLDGRSLARLSHCNRRLYNLLDDATGLWARHLNNENHGPSDVIDLAAEALALATQANPLKMKYLLQLFSSTNWLAGRFRHDPVFDSYKHKFCYHEIDEATLAAVEWNWRSDNAIVLHIWDALSKRQRKFHWHRPWAMKGVVEIRSSSIIQSLFIIKNVAVLHLTNYLLYRCTGASLQAVFAVAFLPDSDTLEDLWSEFSDDNGVRLVWQVGRFGHSVFNLSLATRSFRVKALYTGKTMVDHTVTPVVTFDHSRFQTSHCGPWFAATAIHNGTRSPCIWVYNSNDRRERVLVSPQSGSRFTSIQTGHGRLVGAYEKSIVALWDLKTGLLLKTVAFDLHCLKISPVPSLLHTLDFMAVRRVNGYTKTVTLHSFDMSDDNRNAYKELSRWVLNRDVRAWHRTIGLQFLHNCFVVCYVSEGWLRVAIKPCPAGKQTKSFNLVMELENGDDNVRFRLTPTTLIVFAGTKIHVFDFLWGVVSNAKSLKDAPGFEH